MQLDFPRYKRKEWHKEFIYNPSHRFPRMVSQHKRTLVIQWFLLAGLIAQYSPSNLTFSVHMDL